MHAKRWTWLCLCTLLTMTTSPLWGDTGNPLSKYLRPSSKTQAKDNDAWWSLKTPSFFSEKKTKKKPSVSQGNPLMMPFKWAADGSKAMVRGTQRAYRKTRIMMKSATATSMNAVGYLNPFRKTKVRLPLSGNQTTSRKQSAKPTSWWSPKKQTQPQTVKEFLDMRRSDP